MLAFAHGLDGLDGIHVATKRNKGFYEWLKQCKNVTENAIRLFNKNNYGYYSINSLDTKLDNIFPSDALYSIKELNNVHISKMDRKYCQFTTTIY